MNAIATRWLRKDFNGVAAVDGIDLDVPDGSVFVASLCHSGLELHDNLSAIVVSLIYFLVFGAAVWPKFRRADIAP
jgi:hypothetical protein